MTIGLLYAIAFVGGFITGLLVMFLFLAHMNVVGTLKIDKTNPEDIRMRLVVENDDIMFKKKRIIFKVDQNANLSHE